MAGDISIVKFPRYAMSGNPVVASIGNAGAASELVRVTVLKNGAAIFSTSYEVSPGVHHFDLGEVMKSAVATPEPPPPPATPDDDVLSYSVRDSLLVRFEHGDDTLTRYIYVHYGQFPDSELLRSERTGGELLEDKIVPTYSSSKLVSAPFFSVRSRSHAVSMYEAELMPLYFLANRALLINVYDSQGSNVFSKVNMNPDQQLLLFSLNLAPLVSVQRKYFRVVFGNNTSEMHVSLSPNPQSRQVREAVFLNSLGFYEKVLLTGMGARTRRLLGGDDDGSVYRQEFLPELQQYRRVGVRRGEEEELRLKAGYATPARLAVIADMMNSERILIDGEPAVCTTGELTTCTDGDSTEPREVELTFLAG